MSAEDQRTILFVNDGLPLLLDALKRFRWDQDLCVKGMWALASMSSSHGACYALCLYCTGLLALVPPLDLSVLRSGSPLQCKLAGLVPSSLLPRITPFAGIEILKLNGMTIARDAMEHNLKHYQLALHFVKTIKNLLATEAGMSAARTNTLDVVCKAIVVSHSGDGMLLWRVNAVLKTLKQAEIASTHDILKELADQGFPVDMSL